MMTHAKWKLNWAAALVGLALLYPARALPAAPGDNVDAGALDSITRRLGAGDQGTRDSAVGDLERMCVEATRPGNETKRTALAAALVERAGTGAGNLAVEVRVALLNPLSLLEAQGAGMEAVSLLDDKEPVIRDAALRALSRNPGDAAGKFFVDKLSTAKGKDAIPFLKGLGYRAQPGVEDAIAAHLDGDESEAASLALGDIASLRAAAALEAYLVHVPKGSEISLAAASQALLKCADRIAAGPAATEALCFYTELATDTYSEPVRLGAFRGVILLSPRQAAVEMAAAELTSPNAGRRAVALGALLDLTRRPVPAHERTVAALLLASDKTPATVRLAIRIAGDAHDRTISKELAAALESPDTRSAAVRALATLGDVSAVPQLLEIASTDGPDRDAARESLARMPDAAADGNTPTVNGALAAAFANKSNRTALRGEAIKALGARVAVDQSGAIFAIAQNESDETLRADAISALPALAKPDQAAGLVTLLATAKSNRERDAAESAVRVVLAKMTTSDDRAAALTPGLQIAKADNRLALIRLLGRTGAASALESIKTYLKDADAPTRDSAVRALVDWPNGDVLPDLLEIAKTGETDTHKVLAVRGYTRLVAAKFDRPATETAKLCAEVLPLARTEERKRIISCLANAECADSFSLVAPMVDDPPLAKEAMAAAAKLGRSAAKKDPVLVIKVMQKVMAKTPETEEPYRNAKAALDEATKFTSGAIK